MRLATELEQPFNFMIGTYYETFERTHENASKLGLFGRDPVTGFTNDQNGVQFTEGDSWSVFGQVIWDITDQWELAAGARYVDDQKDGTQRHVYVHQLLQLIAWLPPGIDLEARTSDTDLSPEVTLTWRPNDAVTVWGAWKNGYKAGGYSTPTVLTAIFGPENIAFGEEDADGFEVGVKTSLFDSSVRLNVTAYDYTFEDLQVSQFRPETTTYVIGNAASASTKGIEFDAAWQVNENLQVYTEFDYNKAKQDSYRTASNGEPLAVQPSYWNLRARITVMSADGKYDFSLIGRNLGDEIYDIGGARPGAITPADQGGGGSRPRSVLFQVTYRI